MKKIILVALAAVGLAACATEDTIVTPKGNAIAFGDAFVDNATKAIYDDEDNKVNSFQVWGTVTGNGNTVLIYDGAEVARNGKGYGVAWDFVGEVPVRYWTPSCSYAFTAIVDATSVTPANGSMPTAINYTADGDKDLLYSTATATTTADATPNVTNGIVAFSMNHLLAKMYFDVTSTLKSPYSIVVKSISVTGFQNKGIYTINGDTWAKDGDDASLTLYFENGAKVFIPVEQTLKATITYDVKFNETVISKDVKKTGNINATTPYAKNTAYKVSASIGLNEIKFSVASVGAFADNGEASVN